VFRVLKLTKTHNPERRIIVSKWATSPMQVESKGYICPYGVGLDRLGFIAPVSKDVVMPDSSSAARRATIGTLLCRQNTAPR